MFSTSYKNDVCIEVNCFSCENISKSFQDSHLFILRTCILEYCLNIVSVTVQLKLKDLYKKTFRLRFRACCTD